MSMGHWVKQIMQRMLPVMMVFAVILGTATAVMVTTATPARVDTTAEAVIGMPFSGKWAYNANVDPPYADANSSHPSVHHRPGGGGWATDVYAAEGTAVKLEIGYTTGALSFSWGSS